MSLTKATFGSWRSPITTSLLTKGKIGLSGLQAHDGVLWWTESRPEEAGRVVLVRHDPVTGHTTDVNVDAPSNCRTRVHEYGGGAYTPVSADSAVWSEFKGQHLMLAQNIGARVSVTGAVDAPMETMAARMSTPSRTSVSLQPVVNALTKVEGGLRYADGVVDKTRNRLVMVGEVENEKPVDVVNQVVAVSLDRGKDGKGVSECVVLEGGRDFYSSPRVSLDGTKLCFVTWDHPQMPWDDTELYVVDLDADTGLPIKTTRTLVSSGSDESVCQPTWTADGKLLYLSDKTTGFYNLHVYDCITKKSRCVLPSQVDVCSSGQGWTLGRQNFHLCDEEKQDLVLCAMTEHGISSLCTIRISTGELTKLAMPEKLSGSVIGDIAILSSTSVAVIAGGAKRSPAMYIINDFTTTAASSTAASTPTVTLLRNSFNAEVDERYMSTPTHIEFPTDEIDWTTGDTAEQATTKSKEAGGQTPLTSHGFFYAPANPLFEGPDKTTKPPCLIKIHGGPTAGTSTTFRLDIAFWTSRGFAVLDVDYGGSQGYGRAYRKRLAGKWGIVDVADCANGALYVAEQGWADKSKLCIDGGSAGGFTTLACLAFRDTFSAGCSLYGVSDLTALAGDTHKFESRYLDGLVGAYPAKKDLYIQRSPVEHASKFSAPLLLLQGDEDKIVPPNQSELIFDAVKAQGIACAYLLFEGEQHGFRQSKNIQRALEAELYFYGKVLGFECADEIEPVEIINLK